MGEYILKNSLVLGASVLALSIAAPMAAPALAQGNSSIVTQAGSGNDLTVDQSGSGNSSTVDQDGTPTGVDGIANEASVTQAGTGGASYVTQTGDNQVTVTQSATSDGVFADITQENAGGGASNVTTLTQDGTGTGYGGAFVSQTGTDGEIEITQGEFSTDAVAVVT